MFTYNLVLLLILTKSNVFMVKKIPASYFYSLLNNDVLSYYPSLVNQVRFIFFSSHKTLSQTGKSFFLFLAKSKIDVQCVFFVCK